MEYNECENDVRDLVQKLNLWKEESKSEFSTFMFNTYAEFSNIISPRSAIIEKGIESLVEEVNGLQAQLSIMTQERNDLNETVENLSCRNRELCDKLEAYEYVKNEQEADDGSNIDSTNNRDREETRMCSNSSDLEENADYEDVGNQMPPQQNKIPSSNQNDWNCHFTEKISQIETQCEEVYQAHQQETRGVAEKNTNEEFVQFEDKRGILKTTLNRSANKGSSGQPKHISSRKPKLSKKTKFWPKLKFCGNEFVCPK